MDSTTKASAETSALLARVAAGGSTGFDTGCPHLSEEGTKKREWWRQAESLEATDGLFAAVMDAAGSPALSSSEGDAGDPAVFVSEVVRQAVGSCTPPASNTGALNTKPSQSALAVAVLVDWCGGTWKQLHLEAVLRLLTPDGEGLDVWQALPTGRNGYRAGMIRGQVRVYYHGGEGMGVYLEASGDACRQLEHEGIAWRERMSVLLDTGFEPARLDVAIDDRVGILNPEDVDAAIDEARAPTRWHEVTRAQSIDCSTGKAQGWSVTYGSKSSRLRLRIYDKRAERAAKGEGVGGHWIRVELQARDARAEVLARAVAGERPGEIVAGVIRRYLEFKQAPTDSRDTNKSRWLPTEWWAAFLGDVEKLELGQGQPPKSLKKAAEYFKRQVACVYALLRLAPDYGDDWLADVFESGARRLQRWQRQALAPVSIQT